jgi:hypothetical protein
MTIQSAWESHVPSVPSTFGGGCLRSTPNIGKVLRIFVATAWFASNISSCPGNAGKKEGE